MKFTARAARYLTGANRPARPLTPADVCAERAAMYGPCGDPGCVTCGPRPPAPLPFDPASAIDTAHRREQRRAELDSCQDFGVDPRYI